jgi:hypothetical protein
MFQIRFVYADGCGESVLDISRATNTENLNWVFRTASGDQTLTLSEFGVYDNLRNVFNLLYWNSTLYSHFEFRTAGFPLIYVNMSDAFGALPYLEYTMFSLLRNTQPLPTQTWENTIEENDEPSEEAADEADDEDDDEDEDEDADDEDEDEEEDQYDDMPPLISLSCPCTPTRNRVIQCPPRPTRPTEGPCHNTRAAKRNRDGTSKPSHIFF